MAGADPREREFERRRELQEEAGAQDAAFAAAGQPEMGSEQARLIEILGDGDVDRDDGDDFGDMVASELSRTHMFANIDEREWESRKPLNENAADRMKAEHPPASGPGSKCTGEVRRIMLDEEEEAGTLTPERSRRYDAAMEAKSSMESLAIGGKAFDGVTKIYAITGRESDEGSGGSSGGSTLAAAREGVSKIIKRGR